MSAARTGATTADAIGAPAGKGSTVEVTVVGAARRARGRRPRTEDAGAPVPGRDPRLTLPAGPPQVDLLPPEIRAARALRVVQRRLGVAVLGVVVVIGASVVAGGQVQRAADAGLERADATSRSLSQQAARYAEVPAVQGAVAAAGTGRAAATAGEVLWVPYLEAVTAVLPAGTVVQSFSVAGPDPASGAAASTSGTGTVVAVDPSTAVSVGTLALQLRSSSLPDTAALGDALASVPGLADPWFSSISLVRDGAGDGYYSVGVDVRVTADALAHRFTDGEG